MRTKSNNGFTLIEIAVVMVIIGFLMAAFFRTLDVQMQQRKIDLTQERLNKNIKALSNFVASGDLNNDGTLEQRLPCPANFNLNSGDTNYGREMCPPASVAAGSTWNGVQVAQRAGQRVFIGAYPFATALTNGEDAKDGYNSKFVYAVTESLTTTGSVASGTPTGVIQVRLDEGGINNTAPFVLVSTGKNGQNSSGTGTDGDEENIDGDAVFTAFAGHRTANNDSYYDDEVAFSLTDVNTTFCVNKMDVQEFSTVGTHTWTKPNNLQYAVVEIWGASGGPLNFLDRTSWEANDPAPASTEPVLGGNGGFAKKVYSGDTLNSTENITIGAGGIGPCYSAVGVYGTRCATPRERGGLGNIYHEGTNARPTVFKNIRLTGGQGATLTFCPPDVPGDGCSSGYVNGTRSGIDGSVTGDSPDFFTHNWPAAGRSSSVDPYLSTSTTGGGGGYGGVGRDDFTRTDIYYNGKGNDGYVVVTSYLCE